ncbi:MAG: hemolysin family protein [Armatimonadota bacterium]|nr:hemolysin family protein [Armatimonadota bacterium]MDR7562323.1 hemolysin family protein [Armatimonadota bacterium]MDR7568142.1 hemolysin family protein [Armatimonadota bacterium]MDR7602428.1 hemolysin family protein [Armatimonadota bacterium]
MAWLEEALVVLLLLLANAAFAAVETAVITARAARLERLRRAGERKAEAALYLVRHRDRFLAAVQIGITLVGTLASAYSGARIAQPLAAGLRSWPFLAPYADPLALGLVVVFLTFLFLVVGELAPKRVSLARAEEVAVALAPAMRGFTRLVAPAVGLLTAATNAVLWLVGQGREPAQRMTLEDFSTLVEESARTGLLRETTAKVLSDVVRVANRRVEEIMTPRTELVGLPVRATWQEVLHTVRGSTYSRFPIYEGDLDHIVGVLYARDLVGCSEAEDWQRLVRSVPSLPGTVRVLEALRVLQEHRAHAAVVLDEYGGTAGWVTLEDILEEIVGEIPSEYGAEEPEIVVREDGSLLVDGLTPLYQLLSRLGLEEEAVDTGEATTVAGLVLHLTGRIPSVGEKVRFGGYEIEVVDLDGRRIDKLLVRPRTS